jgi:hypothetical protein
MSKEQRNGNKNVFPTLSHLSPKRQLKRKGRKKKKTVPPGFRRYASFDSRQHHSGAAGNGARACHLGLGAASTEGEN